MNRCAPDDIVFLVIVAGRKQKSGLLTHLLALDCRIVNTLYGKSSIQAGHLVEMLGFVPEENKVVITCILKKENVDGVFQILLDDFQFGRPNTGIAFTLPISGISL
ncbi:MAG: hypothetical protein VB062_02670 [Christensenella sp.]|nr:hypothetical protein [Christensenella sp.]